MYNASDFEDSLRVWGCVYGIAFGLARTEEPCESAESVANRAFEAAWPVFTEYTGGFKVPDTDTAIEQLADAYQRAGLTSSPDALPRTLCEAIEAVLECRRVAA